MWVSAVATYVPSTRLPNTPGLPVHADHPQPGGRQPYGLACRASPACAAGTPAPRPARSPPGRSRPRPNSVPMRSSWVAVISPNRRSSRGSPTWASARSAAVTWLIVAFSPSTSSTRSRIALSKPRSRVRAVLLADADHVGEHVGERLGLQRRAQVEPRQVDRQHPDQRVVAAPPGQLDQVLGDRALGQVEHGQVAAAVEAGGAEQGDQRRPAGQRAAGHVDPVDLVGHGDRVPGELAVVALLPLLPLAVALRRAPPARGTARAVALLRAGGLPRLLLAGPGASPPGRPGGARSCRSPRRRRRRSSADQRERPAQQPAEAEDEDQRGQHQHERADRSYRPVEQVLLQPLPAQPLGVDRLAVPPPGRSSAATAASGAARDPGAAGRTASPGRCGPPGAARARDARPPRGPPAALSSPHVTAYKGRPPLGHGSPQSTVFPRHPHPNPPAAPTSLLDRATAEHPPVRTPRQAGATRRRRPTACESYEILIARLTASDHVHRKSSRCRRDVLASDSGRSPGTDHHRDGSRGARCDTKRRGHVVIAGPTCRAGRRRRPCPECRS